MAKSKTARRAAPAKKNTKKTVSKSAPKKAAKTNTNANNAVSNQAITPYLSVNNGVEAIAWYKKAVGAKQVGDINLVPGNKVMHAALKLGDSTFYLSDIFPGSDAVDPARAGASVTLSIYHKDCDKIWARMVENGAKVTMPIDDMFWGDRYGKLLDPFGHSWSLSRKSKLTQKELNAKREAAMAQFGQMTTA